MKTDSIRRAVRFLGLVLPLTWLKLPLGSMIYHLLVTVPNSHLSFRWSEFW